MSAATSLGKASVSGHSILWLLVADALGTSIRRGSLPGGPSIPNLVVKSSCFEKLS